MGSELFPGPSTEAQVFPEHPVGTLNCSERSVQTTCRRAAGRNGRSATPGLQLAPGLTAEVQEASTLSPSRNAHRVPTHASAARHRVLTGGMPAAQLWSGHPARTASGPARGLSSRPVFCQPPSHFKPFSEGTFGSSDALPVLWGTSQLRPHSPLLFYLSHRCLLPSWPSHQASC